MVEGSIFILMLLLLRVTEVASTALVSIDLLNSLLSTWGSQCSPLKIEIHLE